MNKIRVSKKFTLQLGDLLRGGAMAALTAALVAVQQLLEQGHWKVNWVAIGMSGVAAGLGYLIKNGLMEPSKIITTVKDPEKVQKVEEILSEGRQP